MPGRVSSLRLLRRHILCGLGLIGATAVSLTQNRMRNTDSAV